MNSLSHLSASFFVDKLMQSGVWSCGEWDVIGLHASQSHMYDPLIIGKNCVVHWGFLFCCLLCWYCRLSFACLDWGESVTFDLLSHH